MNIKSKFGSLLPSLLFFIIGAFFTGWNYFNNLDKDTDYALRYVVKEIDGVFDKASIVAELAGKYLDYPCSDWLIRNLSRFTASRVVIRSVNIIRDGEWYCSSVSGRESLGIDSVAKKTHTLVIQFVMRQNSGMYMVYFPINKQVIAIAVYQTVINKIITNVSQNQNLKAVFHLMPGSDIAYAYTLRSEKYPYSVELSSRKGWLDFLNQNILLLIMLGFFSYLIYKYLERIRMLYPVRLLQKAISQREFIPFYQPIVELTTGKIIGAEVLVRWNNPQLGIISPNEFIHTMEKNMLINSMTISLISHIHNDMNKLRFHGEKPFHLSVNISPESLEESSFSEQCLIFIKKLRSMEISVVLEITERQQNNISNATLNNLKENNVAIALDDFGTGFSNYAALQQLDPLLLKIDKMFISGIGKGGTGDTIVNNIVHLSEMLRKPLVAEGIEEEAQAETLRQLGVKYGQGFLYSKPLPFDAFYQLIKLQI